jgi:hypothetical protein
MTQLTSDAPATEFPREKMIETIIGHTFRNADLDLSKLLTVRLRGWSKHRLSLLFDLVEKKAYDRARAQIMRWL